MAGNEEYDESDSQILKSMDFLAVRPKRAISVSSRGKPGPIRGAALMLLMGCSSQDAREAKRCPLL